MPKISAATVAEHHEQQHRAVLDAALALLTENADAAPTLGDVAARAGLARSSVYNYFKSREDLYRALLVELFPRWNEQVLEAMDAAPDPTARVRAYVDVNLDLVADGEHAMVWTLTALLGSSMSPEEVASMHAGLVEPLVAALGAAGDPAPAITAALINAMVHQGTTLIESGADAEVVKAAVDRLLPAEG